MADDKQQIANNKALLANNKKELANSKAELKNKKTEVTVASKELAVKKKEVTATNKDLAAKKKEIITKNKEDNANPSSPVNKRLDKFGGVFKSIENGLIQNANVLEKMLDIQLEGNEASKRANQLASVGGSSSNNTNSNNTNSIIPNPTPNNNDKKSIQGGLFSFIGGIFSSLPMGLFAGMGAVAAMGFSPFTIAKMIFSKGTLLLLAPLIGDFLGDFVGQSLKNVGFDGEIAGLATDTVSRTATAGAFGLALSRRLLVPGLLFGLSSSLGDNLLDAMGYSEEQMQEEIDLFGFKMANEDLAGAGIGIAAGASYLLFRSNLLSTMSKMKLGAAAVVPALFLAYGDEAKQYITDNTNIPEDFVTRTVDIVGYAASGASMLGMFGPKGLVIGAALGLAVGIGVSLFDWITDRKAKSQEKIKEDLEKLNRVLDGEMTNEDRSNLLSSDASVFDQIGVPETFEKLKKDKLNNPDLSDIERSTFTIDYLGAVKQRLINSNSSDDTIEQIDNLIKQEEINLDSLNLVEQPTMPLSELNVDGLNDYIRGLDRTEGAIKPQFGTPEPILRTDKVDDVLMENDMNAYLNGVSESTIMPILGDDRLSRLISILEENAMSMANQTVIVNAPTNVGPRVTNLTGGTNVSTTSFYGSGSGSSLDSSLSSSSQ